MMFSGMFQINSELINKESFNTQNDICEENSLQVIQWLKSRSVLYVYTNTRAMYEKEIRQIAFENENEKQVSVQPKGC